MAQLDKRRSVEREIASSNPRHQEHLPFVRKFRWNIWHRKQERDWIVPFIKYRSIFRFLSTWSLLIQTNGTKNFGRFGKNETTVIPRKPLLFFSETFHRDEPLYLNSPRNFRVFHTSGKRSSSNTQSLKITKENALPLLWHLQVVRWVRTKNLTPRLTALSLSWLLWDVQEPTVLFLKSRDKEFKTPVTCGTTFHGLGG